MTKNYLLFFSLIFFQLIYSQGGSCPEVFASADQTLPCTATCTNISATAFDVGETSSYVVNSIPHSPPIAYNAAGGIGVSVGTDDVWSSIINLPFPFCYFGQTYTTCKIGSNGGVFFAPASSGGYNPWSFTASIPSTALSSAGQVFGPYHDIDPSVAGSVKYYIQGSAPCRKLIVVFNDLAHYNCNSQRSTHMMVFYETTNIIEVYIQNKETCGGWNNGNTVIGIQNPAGTVGYTPPGRNTGSWTVSTPEAWQFKPDGLPIYTAIEWLENGSVIGSGNTLSVCPSTPSSTYTARTTYTRCDGLQIVETDDVTVSFSPDPIIAIDPSSLFTCSGQTTTLQAQSLSVVDYLWSPGGETTSSIDVSPGTSTTYSVTVTDTATGCTAQASSAINIATPTANSCNVLYVTPSATSSGDGTKANPIDLSSALEIGACNGTTIKMALGDYVTDTAITGITSYLTLEGGFDDAVNWEKVSTVGGTRILRTATMSTSLATGSNSIVYGTGIQNESGPDPKIVAIDISSQMGFRFQDITIETVDFGSQSAIENYQGVSTIGVHLTACSDYNFVRTNIQTGSASHGYDQVWSYAATNGGSSYGIRAISNGANGNIINSSIYSGSYGFGGSGSPSGSNGSSGNVSISGTPLATQDDNFDLAGQSIIRMDDISCTNTLINFSNISSAAWSFGSNSTPSTAVGTNVSTQYSTIGRKNINFGTDLYTGFSNILLDDQIIPNFTTTATFVQGQYRVCAGDFVGFISSNGGVGYVYEWDLGGAAIPNTYSGATYSTIGATFNTPGVYTISLHYVTNCCGASVPTTLDIYVEERPTVSLPSDISLCLGDNTSTSITAIGLTNNSSINWSPSAGLDRTDSTTVIALPLTTTNYIATVTDSTGMCTYADTINVAVVDLLLDTATTSSNCVTPGTATVSVLPSTGASGNYSYAWSNGDNTQTITGLQPDTYTALVTDNILGCVDSINAIVNPGPGALIASSQISDISCFGNNDGKIVVTVQGGALPYNYSWSNGINNLNSNNLQDSIINLSAGNYDLTITDFLGCTYTLSSLVEEPNQIVFAIDSVRNPTCVGIDDGFIVIRPDGGVRPYSFTWTNGTPVNVMYTDVVANNLQSDNYTLILTDTIGCQDSITIPLVAPLVSDTITDTICAGESYLTPNNVLTYPTNDSLILDTLVSFIGCDSVVLVELYVNPTFTNPFDSITICEGDSYVLPSGNTATNPGIYIDTLNTINGCDSVLTTHLFVDSITNVLIIDTVCQGESLIVNGESYNSPGNYLDTAFYSLSGCDSLHFDITLHVDSFESVVFSDTICQGESLIVNGESYNSPGNYLDTAFYSLSGCDSLHFDITLHVDSVESVIISDTVCQGSSITVNGESYNSPGNYLDTAFYTLSGCDSIHFDITLHVDSVENIIVSDTVCQGSSITVNGETYNTPGNYLDTAFYSLSGCDSIHFDIMLHVDSFENVFISDTVCQGSSITVNGETYNSPGNYLDTAFYTLSGCDSIHFDITLHVDSIESVIISDTICQGENLIVNGESYNSPGNYLDTAFYTLSGCDSIHFNITLHVDSVENIIVSDTVCQGENLIVNGESYNSPGNYLDTAFYTLSGCDSIHFDITLHVDSVENIIVSDTVCQGSSITVNGEIYNTPGNYLDTAFYTLSGCDSIHFDITLHVDSVESIVVSDTVCQGSSIIVNGETYNSPGNYLDTAFYILSGCDSIHFDITLHVDSVESIIVSDTICQGGSIMVNGESYTSPGNYLDTAFYTLSGCDSIHFDITLHVDSFESIIVSDTVCQGGSIMVNGKSYNSPGNYLDTAFYTLSGCDSIHFDITLHVDSFESIIIFDTICEGENLIINGESYNSPGNYLDTAFYTLSACDSIHFNITLHVDSVESVLISDTICQGESLIVNGESYNSPGNYLDTAFYTLSACDSIHFNITLHVDSVESVLISDTICQGESLIVNGESYNSPGNYLDTAYYTLSGCDSLHFNITLHVDSVESVIISDTICQGESLIINGIPYTNSGQYFDTLNYLNGCDSIHFDINILVDTLILTNIDTNICQGYNLTVNGKTYNNTGLYYDTIRFVNSGCDSLQYTINLSIDSVYNDTINPIICANESYTLPDASTVNTSGTYHFPDVSIAGCDSLYTVNLTVNALPISNKNVSICTGDSVFLAGSWQHLAGIYTDTFAMASPNCDTIINTTLTVNNLPNVVANANDTALCQGETLILSGSGANSYNWTNSVVDNTGFIQPVGTQSYIVTGIDANNCENTDTISVSVSPTYSSNDTFTICEDALPFIFHDGTPHNSNTAVTHINNLNSINACDSIITTYLSVNKIAVVGSIPDSIIACDDFSRDLTITAQNIVSYQWQVDNGLGFSNLLDTGIYSGTNTSSLSISSLDTSLNGNIYRIVMYDECGNGPLMDSSYFSVFAPHDVSNPVDDIERCAEEDALISVDYNGYNYIWSNGQTGQYLQVTESGNYIVNFIENGTNCEMADEILVTINNCIDNCVVEAPTGFSPNASSKNDVFKVITTCDEGFSFFEFRIFNRWGEEIFFTDNPSAGWDGMYKNSEANIGVYTYTVEFVKNLRKEKEMLSGNVTLIR